jgi:hypothetical protein
MAPTVCEMNVVATSTRPQNVAVSAQGPNPAVALSMACACTAALSVRGRCAAERRPPPLGPPATASRSGEAPVLLARRPQRPGSDCGMRAGAACRAHSQNMG